MSENVWCLRLIWLKAKLIIRLPLSSSFSGSCSFLSYSFLYTTLLCPLILSHFLCSWSPFCRLQDLSCSWSGVYPLGVRLVKRLVPYPLEGGFVCCYCDQSLCWILRGTSPLLCGCHCPVCGGVCSLVGGTEPLDLFLWFWSVWRQVGLENTPWERSPWGLPLWGISHQGVFSASPSCLVRALMWPWLALRLAPPWPWAWWHTALVPLRCCFPRVTSIDPLDSGPRIAFIMELGSLRCHGGSSDSGLVLPPSVPVQRRQLLQLHLPWLGEPWLSIQMLCTGWGDKASCGYKSMACVADTRDFSFFSSPWGSAVLSLHLYNWPTTRGCS